MAKTDPFPKARVARELLRDKAKQILEEYLDVAVKAKDAGDYETAYKSLQWLMEHMPQDEDGKGVVDTSVDKQKQIADTSKPTGPQIQIGIAVGGIGHKQKALPQVTVETVDAES